MKRARLKAWQTDVLMPLLVFVAVVYVAAFVLPD